MCKFRDLTEDDIEVRVQSMTAKGAVLLLYKNARVDMNILDETVGSLNWQKNYRVVKDNLYCTIAIWDAEKMQWIAKEDCGIESQTEKEKGEASDAQKRAGFAWGIGRELYTSPFIFVKADEINITERNGKPTTYDKFAVEKIVIENKTIKALAIRNVTTGKRVFVWQKES